MCGSSSMYHSSVWHTGAGGLWLSTFRNGARACFTNLRRQGERIDLFVLQSMAWILRVAVPLALLLVAAICITGQGEMEGTLMFLHVWKVRTVMRQSRRDLAEVFISINTRWNYHEFGIAAVWFSRTMVSPVIQRSPFLQKLVVILGGYGTYVFRALLFCSSHPP